jgi:hypothetical protein
VIFSELLPEEKTDSHELSVVTTVAFTVMGSVAIESTDIDLALCPEYYYDNRLEFYCTPAFSTVKILEISGFSIMALST